MTTLTKTYPFLKVFLCTILVLVTSVVYAQDNPSSINFKVKKGESYTFQIASTSIPNFELVSQLADWGNVKRYEDSNRDNIYDVEFTAPITYEGQIEFMFTYTGVNPFPFYTYTRKVKIMVDVVPSVISIKDDVIDYSGEIPMIINPLENDLGESQLSIAEIASATFGNVEILDPSSLAFYPSEAFDGNSLITYVAEDSFGTREKGNIYILQSKDITESLSVDLTVSSETPALIFLPNAEFIPEGSNHKKGILTKAGDLAYSYSPIAGKLGSDIVTFSDGNNHFFIVNIKILDNAPDLDGVNDDYFYTAANQTIEFNVALNDYIDPSNIVWFSGDLTKISDGVFSYTPPADFTGFKNFAYKINTGISILKGNIQIKVDNYLPEEILYKFDVPSSKPLVLEYNVPIDDITFTSLNDPKYGTLEIFYEDITIDTECGTLGKVPKVIYTPRAYFVGFDEFNLEYCTGANVCQVVKTKVNVYTSDNEPCGCVNGCVYPGDANKDGVVNVNDLLDIGLYMGASGPARENKGNQWKAYVGEEWKAYTALGTNLKYVDSDGNGLITAADTLAVIGNYGKYSSFIPTSAKYFERSPLKLVPRTTEVEPGDEFLIDVYVGDDRYPVLDMHGLAFSISLNPSTFDMTKTTFIPDVNSWLSEGFGTMNIARTNADGKINVGITRISGLPKSGKGKIGTFSTIVVDEIEGFRIGDPYPDRPIDIDIDIEDITGMDSEGSVYTLPVTGSRFTINLRNNRSSQSLVDDLNVYPNPAKDFINIHLNGGKEIQSIKLMDFMGKTIIQAQNLNAPHYRMNTASLSSGIYLVEVSDGQEVETIKVEILE